MAYKCGHQSGFRMLGAHFGDFQHTAFLGYFDTEGRRRAAKRPEMA
jgi:hypothetical protein